MGWVGWGWGVGWVGGWVGGGWGWGGGWVVGGGWGGGGVGGGVGWGGGGSGKFDGKVSMLQYVQITSFPSSMTTFTPVFICNQADLWMVQSVRPSVTPFWLCSHHHIIMKFSGVITSDRSDVHAKGQGHRSRSQRSQPNLTVSGL